MNNRKLTIHLLGCFFILVISAAADITIDYTAQIGQRQIVDPSGQLVSDDRGQVRLGLLTNDFDLATHGSDLLRLNEAWISLDTTAIREVLGEAGKFSARVSLENPQFEGRKLYLWVLTTTGGDEVTEDLDNVLGHGIFSSSSPAWHVPYTAGAAPQNSTLIHSSQIDQAFGGASFSDHSLWLTEPVAGEVNYHQWQVSIFPPGTLDEYRGPLADPDGDGIVNLIERFVGSDPTTETIDPFETTISQSTAVVRFQRSVHASAGDAELFISNNLSQWAEVGSITETQVASISAERDQVTMTIPLDQLPPEWRGSLFFRLTISLTE